MLGAGAPAERFGRSNPSRQIGPSRSVGSLSKSDRPLPLVSVDGKRNPVSPAARVFPRRRPPRLPSSIAALAARLRRPPWSSVPALGCRSRHRLRPCKKPTHAVVASVANRCSSDGDDRSSPACSPVCSPALIPRLRTKKIERPGRCSVLQPTTKKATTSDRKSFNRLRKKLQPVYDWSYG